MNLREIRSTHQKERQKDDLQHLDDTFYQDVAEYLEELYAERERVAEQSDDPFSSSDVQRLTDTIETIEQTVEALYERRTGKIVKKASFASAGMPADAEATTDEEKKLFDSLVDELDANRETVLSVLAGDDVDEPGIDETEDGDRVSEEEDDGRRSSQDDGGGDGGGFSLTDAMDSGKPGGIDPENAPEPTSSNDSEGDSGDGTEGEGGDEESEDSEPEIPRMTVQITSDVGSIYGVDEREYHLEEDDVVSLPSPNAAPLLKKDAAKPLD